MSNIAIFPPTDAQLADMPLLASIQYFEPRPASAINRIMTGLFPNALYEKFTLKPQSSGLGITVLAAGGLALVGTVNGESIKVEGQRDIDKTVSVGVNYIFLVANFQHNTITKQVDTSSAINPADIVVSDTLLPSGLLIGTVTVPSGATKVTTSMFSYDAVKRFSFADFARQAEFDAHHHDERYLGLHAKADKAYNSDRFGNQPPYYYAKASQVLTDVPNNAVFTDTQRPLSNSVASTSQTVAATSKAAKTAYDKGEEALAKANTKLDAGAKAVDSDKLDGHDSTYFAKASQVLTDVPEDAVFTDTNVEVLDTVLSNNTKSAASANSARRAYTAGVEALNKANTKLDADAKAVDSDLLDGHDSAYFARAAQVLTDVPENALFTDTNTWRSVVDSLTSTSTTTSLTANQGRVLKGMIDQLMALVSSDDTTLDDIQEIVDFIKQNKDTLDSLAISNIAGLQAALDSKFDKATASEYAHKASNNQFLAQQEFFGGRRAVSIGDGSSHANLEVSMYMGGTNGDYGFELIYDGRGYGNENAFRIESANNGSAKTVLHSLQDGKVNLPQLGAQVAGNVIWHAGNQGTGSGMDADKLDGLHASQFIRSDLSDTVGGRLTFTRGTTIGKDIDNLTNAVILIDNGSSKLGFDANEIACSTELLITVPSGVKINDGTVWHANNDGSGSGLDADKLDGQEGSYYAKASQVLTDVPAGAVFTDTQRPLSSSVSSTSESAAATSKAAKSAYDRGTSALNVANTKLDSDAKAVDSDKLDGHDSAYFAKASQVLTNVPAGAKFTDTQRAISDSVTSTSTTTSASSKAARTAYDKGVEALAKANTKLGATAKAKDAGLLDGKDSSHYVNVESDQTIAGKKKFTNEIGFGDNAAIKYDAATDSIMFVFD